MHWSCVVKNVATCRNFESCFGHSCVKLQGTERFHAGSSNIAFIRGHQEGPEAAGWLACMQDNGFLGWLPLVHVHVSHPIKAMTLECPI